MELIARERYFIEPVKGGYMVRTCALFYFMRTMYPVCVTTQTSRKAHRRRIPPSNPIIRFSWHPPDMATASPDLKDLKVIRDFNALNANV